MSEAYIPQAGDIIWIDFEPQAGRETKKRRPALVLSHGKYNEKVGLAVICPITSSQKGYPFEVVLSKCKTEGVVLSDHVRSFDWRVRNAVFIEKAKPNVLSEVRGKLSALIF